MKRTSVFLFLFLFSSHSLANFGGGISGAVLLEESTESQEVREPILAGYVFGAHENGVFHYSLELGYFKNETSEGGLSILREHYEYNGLIKISPWKEFSEWYPHMGMGVGLFQEKITTKLGSIKDEQTSRLEGIGHFVLGSWGRVFRFKNEGAGLSVGGDLRLSHSNALATSPIVNFIVGAQLLF